MITDRTVLESAQQLLEKHGVEGTLEWCERRKAEMAATDDAAGVAAWIQLEEAVRELADHNPAGKPVQ
jgi:hypothetical protein